MNSLDCLDDWGYECVFSNVVNLNLSELFLVKPAEDPSKSFLPQLKPESLYQHVKTYIEHVKELYDLRKTVFMYIDHVFVHKFSIGIMLWKKNHTR